MNIAQLDKKTWKQITILSTILAAACAGWTVWSLSEGSWNATVTAGFLGAIIVFPLTILAGTANLKLNYLNRKLDDLEDRMERGHVSLREMTNLRPLLDGPPLDFGEWAVDPHFGKVLAQLINRYEPKHILECGSGTSTVLASHLQHSVDSTGTVTALEHLAEYAEESRQLLDDNGLTRKADIVLAPLKTWNIDERELTWYDVDPDRLTEEPIDMMIVDGPPGSSGPLARYAAAFVLQPYLSEDCVIVMDDGNRPDEERAAYRWSELLEADLEYLDGPKGTFVLRC